MAEKYGSSETVQQVAGRGKVGQTVPGYGMGSLSSGWSTGKER